MALVETKYGPMDESVLEKRTGGDDNQLRTERWVEYWFSGELVHRSAQIDFKVGLGATLTQGMFGR